MTTHPSKSLLIFTVSLFGIIILFALIVFSQQFRTTKKPTIITPSNSSLTTPTTTLVPHTTPTPTIISFKQTSSGKNVYEHSKFSFEFPSDWNLDLPQSKDVTNLTRIYFSNPGYSVEILIDPHARGYYCYKPYKSGQVLIADQTFKYGISQPDLECEMGKSEIPQNFLLVSEFSHDLTDYSIFVNFDSQSEIQAVKEFKALVSSIKFKPIETILYKPSQEVFTIQLPTEDWFISEASGPFYQVFVSSNNKSLSFTITYAQNFPSDTKYPNSTPTIISGKIGIKTVNPQENTTSYIFYDINPTGYDVKIQYTNSHEVDKIEKAIKWIDLAPTQEQLHNATIIK